MKKRILVLAALFASLFALASCGPDNGKSKFTVSFDAAGGTPVKFQTVEEGKTVIKPADPLYVQEERIKEFLGWHDENGNLYDFSAPVTGNVSLTAKWAEEYGVLAGGTSGKLYNFKYANAEYRELLCATLERWLIDKGISIPLYYTNGLVMYNERITPATEEYVAYMGYGASYGSFTGEDNYRTSTTAMADSANKFDYRSDSDSAVIGMIEASLYVFDWNKDFTGFEVLPELASGFPVPVAQNEAGEWVETEENPTYESLSRSWKVAVRTDMKFSDGSAITLKNFEDNLKILLDPEYKYYRANACYSGSFVIANAKKYYDGEVAWEKVGFTFDAENNCIIYTLTQELSQIDFMYNTSSYLFGVADKEFHDALGKDGFGAIPQGTTEFKSVKASGEFIVDYYEDEKQVRYVKNPEYVPNPLRYHGTVFSKFTETKVGSAEAAWELFLAGELDAASVPSAEYANYVNDPRAKVSPGATVWRLSVNQASDEYLKEFTGGAWEGNVLMQNRNFQWALYFGVNRKHVAENIVVSGSPCQFYVNDTYKVAVQAPTGYRSSEAAALVAGTTLTETGIDLLEESYGYSEEDALAFYIAALDEIVAAQKVDPSKATTLKVELNNWPATSTVQVNVTNYIAQEYERIFNSQTKYPNIKVEFDVLMTDSSTSYYGKQMLAQYDLAMAGISGGALDILGLFDVWSSSDLNGLRLSFGVNTESVVKYDDLILWDGEYWTYDALVAAASAPAWIVCGAKNDNYTEAVSDASAKMDALNAHVAAGLEGEAAEAWEATYKKAVAKLEAVVTPAEAYAVLEDFIATVEAQLGQELTDADLIAIYGAGNYTACLDWVALYAVDGGLIGENPDINGDGQPNSILEWLEAYEYTDYAAEVKAYLEAAEAAIAAWEAEGGKTEANSEALAAAAANLAGWYSSMWSA